MLCIRPVLNTLADNEGEEANKKRRIFFWILYLQTQFAPFYFKSFEIQCKCRCTWRWINPKEVYLLNVNAFLTTLYVYTGSPDQNCYTLAIQVHKANNSVLNLNETITHVMKLAYNCLTRNQSYKIALMLFERTILKLHV